MTSLVYGFATASVLLDAILATGATRKKMHIRRAATVVVILLAQNVLEMDVAGMVKDATWTVLARKKAV
jgi:hypothetical protein